MVGSLFVGICGYLWVFVVCGSRADGIVPRSMADGGGTCAGWAMFGHLHGEIGRRLCVYICMACDTSEIADRDLPS